MKKIGFQLLASVFVLLFAVQANAQDKPAPSPLGKVYQRVGVTDVEFTYSRPSAKERTIFAADGLVPFGKLWRTGANAATKVSFSTDVTVGGQKVPAGTYALFSIPNEKEWTIILNSDAAQRGTGSYDKAKDVARFTVEATEFPFPVEMFTIVIGNVKPTSADVSLVWATTGVNFSIEVEKTWE